MTDVLLICGAAGVGKSSVAHELSRQLEANDVSHVLIDTDELDRIYPVPDDLPAIAERNLAAMWKTFAERGATRLILVGVYLDRPSERTWIGRAVPHPRVTAVRLVASRDTLVERVHDRERGSGLSAQLGRSMRQLDLLEDYPSDATFVVTDDLSLTEIGARIGETWAAHRAEGKRSARRNLSGGG